MQLSSCIYRGLIKSCAAVMLCAGVGASPAQEGLPQGIIVKYRDPSPSKAADARSRQVMADTVARYGTRVTEIRRMTNGAQVLSIDSQLADSQIKQLLADLSSDPSVEFAEEDKILQVAFAPNDPRYNEQWHYFEAAGGINLPAAWDLATGKGVTVAVVDTGYRPHADLVENIVGGYDLVTNLVRANDGDARDSSALDPGNWLGDDCRGVPLRANARALTSDWHGTHTAGTVAARTNNGVGVAGVAFDAKVVPVRALGRCGGALSDIADAIAWAAGAPVTGVPVNPLPARVVNLSLGIDGECPNTMQQAIDAARSRGVTVVVAAGNYEIDVRDFFPSNCRGVIVVAAVGQSGGRASYSNFGDLVDIAAPGGDFPAIGFPGTILSTSNTGRREPGDDMYLNMEGTSMAAPHVTGVVALMYSVKPSLTPDQVESVLKQTARPFVRTCNQCGAGVVDAAAAVAAAKALQ